MPIENNLPIIFDTATQTEDGLMSYQDKIKLDSIDGFLSDKVGKNDKITSSQLDTSSDAAKIQPANLSDEVKKMMTGKSSVDASVPNSGVTTEKLAENAVVINKIDKRVLLGNVVSPRPLNFAFDTKKVSITIPQGTLFLTDATTSRVLTTGADTRDVTVNLNYPTDFNGLNFIVSAPSGTLSMINHRKLNTIGNSNSIMALVSLSSSYEASIVMNGNYTINGLAQGVGTESAALLGTGKIIFDALTGIIDFTNATQLFLVVGGMLKTTISSQSSIRLANYSDDSIYSLYWDNTTSSLKTSLSTVTNVDTDICKIAMIKDGRIIPFVNTGIFYSKPYIEAPYYTDSFDFINNINLISNIPLNIVTKGSQKLEIGEETYVCLNDNNLKVKNTECYYQDREGLYYILFDLDNQTISCKHYREEKDTTKKNIVVGTMWISNKFPEVTGNFQYTVDGKKVYQDDLSDINSHISNIQSVISSDLDENRILAGNQLYMINGEELPIYSSSMLIEDTEGIKPAISYNKKNNIMSPRTEFFDGDILIEPSNVGNTINLLVSDKYNRHSYLSKSLNINAVDSTKKKNSTIKILCLGDDLISDKIAYYVKNKLTSLEITPTMLGTMINDQVYGEGRDGWLYSTFVGASGRGVREGKINPQSSKGVSSILMNPFIRIATADDKANKPNDCYRVTGSYTEKNYYTDSDKNGSFYIFDFSKYLEVQGIETPDVVVIGLKPEMALEATEDVVSFNMIYLKQLVSGIRSALPDTTIALIPQYGISTVYPELWEKTYKMIEETLSYVSELKDDKIKVISSWLHMCREYGNSNFEANIKNTQLYENTAKNYTTDKLSETAKIELANTIVSFILNM